MLMDPSKFSDKKKEAFNRYQKLLFALQKFGKDDLSLDRQIAESRTREAWKRFLSMK
jgi:hypothetical protein